MCKKCVCVFCVHRRNVSCFPICVLLFLLLLLLLLLFFVLFYNVSHIFIHLFVYVEMNVYKMIIFLMSPSSFTVIQAKSIYRDIFFISVQSELCVSITY